MCEIPSNVILAEEFAQPIRRILHRQQRSHAADTGGGPGLRGARRACSTSAMRRSKRMIVDVIERAHRCGTKVGICGQAPSNYPEFAAFLVEAGIDSISLNPDSFVATCRVVADAEKKLAGAGMARPR